MLCANLLQLDSETTDNYLKNILIKFVIYMVKGEINIYIYIYIYICVYTPNYTVYNNLICILLPA